MGDGIHMSRVWMTDRDEDLPPVEISEEDL